MQTLKELIPVLQGIADGSPWQLRGTSGLWVDAVPSSNPLACIAFRYGIRLKPWTLPDPPAGKSWHRTDRWCEEDLPPGWRPLLRDETHQEGDFVRKDCSWEPVNMLLGQGPHDLYLSRTCRPLPAEPEWIPLEPCDVPPGTVLRGAGELTSPGWCLITSCSQAGIRLWRHSNCNQTEITWRTLMEAESEIRRPGISKWLPCRKRKLS